ncbi:MAG: hypothetical protein QNJ73_05840 [Gammaproteobacteria bacterium]|nr:hypothetical protein [Gammaproteobacteria bacterium]
MAAKSRKVGLRDVAIALGIIATLVVLTVMHERWPHETWAKFLWYGFWWGLAPLAIIVAAIAALRSNDKS